MRFEQPLERCAIANVELHVGCTGVVGTKVRAHDRPPRRYGLEKALAEEAGSTCNQDLAWAICRQHGLSYLTLSYPHAPAA